MEMYSNDESSPDRGASHHDISGQELEPNLDENMDVSAESEVPVGNQVLTPIEKRRVALSILLHVTETILQAPSYLKKSRDWMCCPT